MDTARSHSPDQGLDVHEAEVLLDLVDETLRTALAGGRITAPALRDLPESLRAPQGVFVSLHVAGSLNGCIGAIEATEPLGVAVVRLALAAAFDDPRLPALRPADYADLETEVSLLSEMTPIDISSREELLRCLRPGVDGIVVGTRRRRGLFLPSVWSQLPTPDEFVDGLWRKAGLVPHDWPSDLFLDRFTTVTYARR